MHHAKFDLNKLLQCLAQNRAAEHFAQAVEERLFPFSVTEKLDEEPAIPQPLNRPNAVAASGSKKVHRRAWTVGKIADSTMEIAINRFIVDFFKLLIRQLWDRKRKHRPHTNICEHFTPFTIKIRHGVWPPQPQCADMAAALKVCWQNFKPP